ncbi:STAS domain-containing protein [Streptomyces canus]|uniref:STAS domain-containing protein n=1 Tax=Streptomyces canus TaxID=58343 RepID=UPI0030E44EA7
MDISNAEPLRQELRELCRGPLDPGSRDGAASVVVDWTAAPFLTMAGVAVLDDFRRQAGERGVPVRVVASRRWPRAVLRIVAFDDVVPVHDTRIRPLPTARPTGGAGTAPGSTAARDVRPEPDGVSGYDQW